MPGIIFESHKYLLFCFCNKSYGLGIRRSPERKDQMKKGSKEEVTVFN